MINIICRETSLSIIWPTTGQEAFIKNADKVDLENFINELQCVQDQIANGRLIF